MVDSIVIAYFHWFRFKRFEVGGLNILPFSLKPQPSGLKARRRLPLSRVGHRADQFQEPETSDQKPATSIEYQESSIKSQ
jgi:hypothetical protein